MASKSVIQDLENQRWCFICGSPHNLHLHHIFQGNAKRKMSDKYGLTVLLCANHHTLGIDAVHNDPKGLFNRQLHEIAQTYYEENIGTREQFIRDFGKSWL